MKLFIDGVLYEADLKKVSEHLIAFYTENSKKMQVLDMGDGKRIDFSRKSIARIALKAAMVPIVVPVVSFLYKMRGLEPPKHEKHEDLIDWMVVKLIEFGGIIEGDVQLNAVVKEDENDSRSDYRIIKSISTFGSNIFGKRLPAGTEPPSGGPVGVTGEVEGS